MNEKSTKDIISNLDQETKTMIVTILSNQLEFNKELNEKYDCEKGLKYAIDIIKEL